MKNKVNTSFKIGSYNYKFMHSHILFILTLLILAIFISSCTNPFAPKFDDTTGNQSSTITDLKTVDGVFQNFQYAYTFKDTSIYGEFIAPDFVFTYRDYEEEVDKSWGREEEMRATFNLFQNTQRLDLIWNNIVISNSDSLNANIVRGFNLTVTYNSTDIDRVDGRVNLSLRKNQSTGKWQITSWIDQSNF
ncbi:MAG TPA: hypothetical protein VLN45_00265 [Ignavibacteriaceae bacterium]|nr:hypothetical protein [Ignavibacteriaceae bacterium]